MTQADRTVAALPALRIGADGSRQIDMRAIAVLAMPLVLNSTLQAVLNLTDTWFIGRLSTAATAAIAAAHWLVLLVLFLIGGVAMGVQTLVAQAYGAGRFRRAGQMAWTGQWAALLTTPIFLLTIVIAPWMFSTSGVASTAIARMSTWRPPSAPIVIAGSVGAIRSAWAMGCKPIIG